MTSLTAERGTLAVIAADFDGLEGGLDRVHALAPLWGGPVALIVVNEIDRNEGVVGRLPAEVSLVAAGGDVAAALAQRRPTPLAQGAALALLQAAADRAPISRVLFMAGADLLPLLPVFADAAFPCPVEVDLLRSAGVPDGAWLWEHCDGLWIDEDSRLYQLATGQPALPVRVAPRGVDDDAVAALRDLPWLTGAPRVSVIAPVHGNANLVLRMADSVLDRTPGLQELILIDDASPDRTAPRLEKLADGDNRVRLMLHDQRRGFAATCNQGLAAARGDVAVVLNADTVVTPGWARRLARHLDQQQNAGAVGPMSNRVSGLQQIAPVDYDERTLAGLTLFSDRMARAAEGRATGVVRLTGLCLAMSRPALRRVGGFDPVFFPGNYEDDDYCLRLIAGGLIPYRADDTFIHHEGSRSFALEPDRYSQYLEDNWRRFKTKWALPADRPRERHYSAEELNLSCYDRRRHFVAPWKAVEQSRVE